MLVSRVPAEMLFTNRLDPDYYAPQHLADERLFQEIGAISLGSVGRLFAGPFGSELPNSVFLEVGVPLFRVGNVGQMEVDERNLARIPTDLHRRLSASEVLPGDLLIVKASVGEKICLLPDSIDRANITQHIIGVRPNGTVDIRYVAAALYGIYGRRQLQRRSLGAIIQYLGVNDARSVLLPRVDRSAQAYIGNKLRQAEVLRLKGFGLKSFLKLFWTKLSGNFCPQGLRLCYRTSSKQIDERLDAWFYNPRFTHAIKATKQLGWRLVPLSKIAKFITNGATPSGMTLSDHVGVNWIRGKDLKKGDVDPYSLPKMDFASERTIARSRLKAGDVVLSIKGTVGEVIAVDKSLSGSNINQDLARIEIGDEKRAQFLAAFFESSLGQVILEQQTYGSVNSFLSLSQLRALPVPDIKLIPRKILTDVATCREDFIRCARASRYLTTAARLLVEALIERKVTEAELIAAHNDKAKDRELLGRLTAKGVDVPNEPPLFPDLDALLDLLETSTSAETA